MKDGNADRNADKSADRIAGRIAGTEGGRGGSDNADRTTPQHHMTAGNDPIEIGADGADLGDVLPDRADPATAGASPWQFQVTVGTTGDPRPGPFFGVALEEVDLPSVLTSPHFVGVLRGLVNDGNRQQDIWVRVGLNGQVDDYEWGEHEQRFPVGVSKAEFEGLGVNERYRAAMRAHA